MLYRTPISQLQTPVLFTDVFSFARLSAQIPGTVPSKFPVVPQSWRERSESALLPAPRSTALSGCPVNNQWKPKKNQRSILMCRNLVLSCFVYNFPLLTVRYSIPLPIVFVSSCVLPAEYAIFHRSSQDHPLQF